MPEGFILGFLFFAAMVLAAVLLYFQKKILPKNPNDKPGSRLPRLGKPSVKKLTDLEERS